MVEKDTEFFKIELATRKIEVDCLHRYVFNQCGAYLVRFAMPDFCVGASEADIAFERQTKAAEALSSPESVSDDASDEYLESLAVCRQIAVQMLDYSTFLMHGAVIALDDQTSFMFTAKSGTGKTTHIRKWLENAPGAFVVNGDKPLIKIAGEEAIAYGTPWCGKEHLNTNIGVPLRAIVLMERSEDNEIEEISFSQAFPTLLQQTYRPSDADKMRKTLSLLSALNGKMKFYRFRFNNLKPDAFRVSYEALTGKRL